jgi:hypothetical protein
VIAKRVVDAHRAVHQADEVMQDAHADASRGLGIAVRHRHRDLLVRGENHLRLVVAPEIDKRVVQAAIARTRQQEDIIDVEAGEQLDHRVGPVLRLLPVGGQVDGRFAGVPFAG